MYETPLIFGHESHLVGLLARPDAGTGVPLKPRPGVLFLNAGLEHRIGPRGLNTAFARAIADAGYPTLRFDYAGTGESRKPQQPLAVDRAEELVIECRAAIDKMARLAGCESVVLIGLCSGADDAHRVALAEPRVVGMVQIDGHAATTPGFVWRYYARRVASPRRWANFAQRMSRRDGPPKSAIDGVDFFKMPERSVLAADLAGLVERDVRLFYIYSGATHGYYNHAGQLRRALADVHLGDALTEHYLPSADHTFSRNAERMQLFVHVIDWLAAHWPAAAAGMRYG
ncbi:hypothetical protein V5738_13370 [Salinisphaera sp. SPP-AMP-43]|uniref:hypothetical protein n=1 Tax=Salinisphaera sp. SPP-AMP-43 TaxID=3121288 RepID=UPI003C6E905E